MEKDSLVFSSHDEVLLNFHKIPVWKKLAYGVGSLAYSMTNGVMGFYFSLFLLEVALLDVEYVLIIVLLGRVWDGVTDPIVGYLCSRTKTKLGQFRPWLILFGLPLAVVNVFLWFVPGIESQILKFLYYIAMYFAVQALLTCVHIPYTALTMHLSYDQKETDSVTLYRLVFEMLGNAAGILAVYTVSYAEFFMEEDECSNGIRKRSREKVLFQERAYRYQATVIGFVSVVSLMVTFFAVKEQKDEVLKKKNLSFVGGIKETFGFKPYRELIGIMLFSWLGLMFAQGNYALYIKYGLGLPDQYPYIVGVLYAFTVLWMPVWQVIMRKYGKTTVYKVAMFVMMPGFIALLFLNYFPYIIYPLAISNGAAIAGITLIPWSMLPDVVDAAYAETGIRREELFYAFFVFSSKCSSGVSLAISTGVYKLGGYDQLACDQPWTVPLLFKILVSGPPVLCIIASLLFLHRYDINEKERAAITEKLRLLRRNSDKVESYTASGSLYGTGHSTLKGEIHHSNTLM